MSPLRAGSRSHQIPGPSVEPSGRRDRGTVLAATRSGVDRSLTFEKDHCGIEWAWATGRQGLGTDRVPGDRRRGDPKVVEERLAGEERGSYKAVAVLHNETRAGSAGSLPRTPCGPRPIEGLF